MTLIIREMEEKDERRSALSVLERKANAKKRK